MQDRRRFLRRSGGIVLGAMAGMAGVRMLAAASPGSASEPEPTADTRQPITLFLCGDVMVGRGIDQILPFPSDPRLHESFVRDARDYLELARRAAAMIPVPATFDYVWGDALDVFETRRPQLRIINLETSITRSDRPWPKAIQYRCIRAMRHA